MESEQFLEVQEFGASLDWATLTSPMAPDEAREFHSYARDYMQREQARWAQVKEAKLGAYVGIKVGDTAWVKRKADGHEMLIASGDVANRLVEDVIAHGVNARPTRIDCQATARCSRPAWYYPETCRAVIHATGLESGRKRRKKISLFDSDRGNTGLTIGARSSQSYLRIYDWDAKHGDRANATLWRHEAEFKADKARAFLEGYRNSQNRAPYCAGVMKATLASVDVPCSWLSDVEAVQVVVGRKITTDEKRLFYIRKVVAPMLQTLVASGYGRQLREIFQEHHLADLFKD